MKTFKKCPDCTQKGACPFADVYTRLIESGAFYEDTLRKSCPRAKPTELEIQLMEEMNKNIAKYKKEARRTAISKAFQEQFTRTLPETITTSLYTFCKN